MRHGARAGPRLPRRWNGSNTRAPCIRRSFEISRVRVRFCGMALEPRTVSLLDAENPELTDMTRRIWIGAARAPGASPRDGGHGPRDGPRRPH